MLLGLILSLSTRRTVSYHADKFPEALSSGPTQTPVTKTPDEGHHHFHCGDLAQITTFLRNIDREMHAGKGAGVILKQDQT